MPPAIATLAYCFGIWGLFSLSREGKSPTSPALWIPIACLLINGSRPLSSWLQAQTATSPDQLLEGSPFDRTIYLGLIAAGVYVLVKRQVIVSRLLSANVVLFPFIFYCAVSICWSDYPGVAFKRWIRLLGDFTTVLVILTDRNPQQALKQVLTRVGYILIPVSILLIKYYPDLARSYDPWTGRQFVSGVSTDKNMLGMTCLIYGLGLLWQFIVAYQEKKGRERTRRLIAHGAALGMLFWLFSSADSMTSLSCFFMGSFLIVVTSFVKMARKPAIIHLLSAAIVGTAIGVLFLHVGEGAALQQMGRNPTLTGRTEIWEGLLHFAGNPLLGTGFDSFWLGDRLTKIWAGGPLLYGINEAHDGYLETYLNLGWIGVTLLGVLIVVGYRKIIAVLRQDPEMGRLRLGLFVAAIVYNFTEAGFRTTCTVWIAFLIAITAVPSIPAVRRPLLGGFYNKNGTRADVTRDGVPEQSKKAILVT